jgi:hypothetical protein
LTASCPRACRKTWSIGSTRDQLRALAPDVAERLAHSASRRRPIPQRIRRVPARRDREMEPGGEGIGREGRLKLLMKPRFADHREACCDPRGLRRRARKRISNFSSRPFAPSLPGRRRSACRVSPMASSAATGGTSTSCPSSKASRCARTRGRSSAAPRTSRRSRWLPESCATRSRSWSAISCS